MSRSNPAGRSADSVRKIRNAAVAVVAVVIVTMLLMHFVDEPAWKYRKAVKLHREVSDTFIFFNAYARPVPLILLVWVCAAADPKGWARWRMIFQVVLGLLIVTIPVWSGKLFIPRIRPKRFAGGEWLESFFPAVSNLDPFHLQSFPSGDAALAFVVSTILAAYFPRHRTILYILAGGCAASRFVFGYHWPSDVFLGCVVGYVVGRGVLLITGGVRE